MAQYPDLPRNTDERSTLTAFLEWQRSTLARKCEGLTAEQLRLRSAAPSTLSLLGLVRHMADVERGWFRRTLAMEEIPYIYSSDSDPDGDFDNIDAGEVGEAFATWRAECEHARQIAAAHQLDDVHADLLRERIDGAVGY